MKKPSGTLFASFILLAFSVALTPCHAAELQGTLKNYPHAVVIVNNYDDFVVQHISEVARVKANASGNFHITLPPFAGVTKLKVVIENESTSFYVSGNNTYDLVEKNKKLSVTEERPGLNVMITSLDDDLWGLSKFFIDTDGRFINKLPPAVLLRKMDSITAAHHTQIQTYNACLEMRAAHPKIFFITTSYRIADFERASAALQQIGDRFLVAHAVNTNDPFYVALLKEYIDAVIGLKNISLKGDSSLTLSSRLAMSDYFASDSLRELAKVIIINNIYENKAYKAETTLELWNTMAEKAKDNLRIALFRKYAALAIEAGNKMKPGTQFPAIPLKNINGDMANITDIGKPFILLDFWATWCTPCKESMKRFPALLQMYGDKLGIVSISVDNDFDKMRNYLTENGYAGKWEMLFNGNKGNYYDKITLNSYPTYYLLDNNLRVVAIPESGELEQTLAQYVK